ncbi:hypothetical protein [Evansella cellulosilytica]|uniref:Uncharacterized protein n=1 Tax=Evansella cellulosilytica (strain ATCC 21833 / DSM 2522 / FERM P-1141 / JCM 9156 / N-4) TaxID=649639 RepID=E6TU61_EVAC2|nr:hypothetical protein [Evansella cellulosilytica]ADU28521.1 hypothetical protein Bcell_0234 [Evansella cellulosilytica DSM 2522]
MLQIALSIIVSFSLFQTDAFQLLEKDPLEPDPHKPLGDVVSIEDALTEFEEIYGRMGKTPTYLPFKPTISGGNVEKSEERVRIDYLDEKSGKTLSIHIHVHPINIKSEKDGIYLENGTEAGIINTENIGFIFVHFVLDDLEYLIGINKDKFNNNEECIDELVKVANSLSDKATPSAYGY